MLAQVVIKIQMKRLITMDKQLSMADKLIGIPWPCTQTTEPCHVCEACMPKMYTFSMQA